jgi:hypothetical protein
VEKPESPDVEWPRSRRFGLADAMILIIAVGLGLALARPAITIIAYTVRADPHWRLRTVGGAIGLVRMLNIVLLNFLFFLLPAFLIVRLRRPRPALRSLIYQPGFVACALPVFTVLATLPLALIPGSGRAGQVIEIGAQILLVAAAPLVWVLLIVMRRWNAEPGWIDRFGRIVGILGMVCTPAHFVLLRLPY